MFSYIFIILIIILFITILFYVINNYLKNNVMNKEHFTQILDFLSYSMSGNNKEYKLQNVNNDGNNINNDSNNINNNTKNVKKNFIKKIFIKKSDHTYYFANKNKHYYMKVNVYNKDYQKNYDIKNYKNEIIGKYLGQKYNILEFKLDFYKELINIELDQYGHYIKIYFNNIYSANEVFYIKKDDKIDYKIDDIYLIYCFETQIGKIISDKSNNRSFKISCLDEYKVYLNLFGIGFITFFEK